MTHTQRQPACRAPQNQSRRMVQGDGMAWQSQTNSQAEPVAVRVCRVLHSDVGCNRDAPDAPGCDAPGFKTRAEAMAFWRQHWARMQARERADRIANRTQEAR